MIKKGFTLVELLGVIVVLGIILVVTVPSVIDTLRRSNANENAAYLTRLYTGAETYLEMNRESYDQLDTVGGRVDIPIKVLMDEGLVKTLGTNPDTGSMILSSHTITATKQADGTIAYAIYANDTNIKSYVQSGLVLHLDAINNVSFGHNNTSTVWNDLSGLNHDAILLNFNYTASSGWGNNYILFDGVNDYAKSYTVPALTTTDSYTWTGYVYIYPETAATHILFGNRYGGSEYPLQFSKMTKSAFEYYYNGTNYSMPYAAPESQWINIAIVKNGANFTYYINGSSVASRAAVPVNMAANPFNIGGNYNQATASEAENAKMMARNILNYNRALTPAEIQSNHQLDLYRYR